MPQRVEFLARSARAGDSQLRVARQTAAVVCWGGDNRVWPDSTRHEGRFNSGQRGYWEHSCGLRTHGRRPESVGAASRNGLGNLQLTVLAFALVVKRTLQDGQVSADQLRRLARLRSYGRDGAVVCWGDPNRWYYWPELEAPAGTLQPGQRGLSSQLRATNWTATWSVGC